MKKVFGLMMVLALAGLVSCGEAVVETPVEPTTVEVEAPVVEVEAPVVEEVAVDPAAVETPAVEVETPVVDETLTPSAE